MIAYLNGLLAEKTPAGVIVECGGVGYEALIPLSTYDRLPAKWKGVVPNSVWQLSHTSIDINARFVTDSDEVLNICSADNTRMADGLSSGQRCVTIRYTLLIMMTRW